MISAAQADKSLIGPPAMCERPFLLQWRTTARHVTVGFKPYESFLPEDLSIGDYQHPRPGAQGSRPQLQWPHSGGQQHNSSFTLGLKLRVEARTSYPLGRFEFVGPQAGLSVPSFRLRATALRLSRRGGTLPGRKRVGAGSKRDSRCRLSAAECVGYWRSAR